MKKNISINISGIIFHIEEDGYEQLEKYLGSIKKYFSSFEESEEIILDIENRIAEIFLAKLNEGKQVITADDVDALVKTMGNVSDFKALEEGDEEAFGASGGLDNDAPKGNADGEGGGQKLFRDRKRQILGGVASGIAHYLRVDPLWIRLLLLILMIDWAWTHAIAPVAFIAYLVLWAILPGRFDLKEDKKVKKIFRDPDKKVLGGVASGIAAYFGTNLMVTRLLFVLAIIPAGAGVFIYIVLWIIVPLAKTVSEKLEMSGEPVTLANIENNIKRGLNIEGKEESTATKVLLFPFRLFSEVIRILGRVLGPLLRFVFEAFRVIGGLFIIGLSLMGLYFLVAGVLAWLGFDTFWMFPVFWGNHIEWPSQVDWEVWRHSLSGWFMIPAYIQALVPILFTFILGASLISRRWIARPFINWGLFGLWVVSLLVFSVTFSQEWKEFQVEGSETETNSLTMQPGETLIVKGDVYEEFGIRLVDVNLHPTSEENVQIKRTISSRGSSDESIQKHIGMVEYDIQVEDTALILPKRYRMTEGALFRGQHVTIDIYVPYGQQFMVDASLRRFFWRERNKTYVYKENGALACVDCPNRERLEERTESNMHTDGVSQDMALEAFTEVFIRGQLKVKVVKGEEHRLQIGAYDHGQDPEVRLVQNRLYIEDKNNTHGYNREVILYVKDLAELTLEGRVALDLSEYPDDVLELTLEGSSSLKGQVYVSDLKLSLENRSKVNVEGSVEKLRLIARDRSGFRGYDLTVNSADIDAMDGAEVRLGVAQSLTVNSTSSRTLKYKGEPENINVRGKVTAVEAP